VAFPLGIIREAVEAGWRSRRSFDRSLRDAPGAVSRGLVVDALEKITGLDVQIQGSLRFFPDGVVIRDLQIGDGMRVEKLLLRAQLQPLLAVLDNWKTDPGTRDIAKSELRILSIRLGGVTVQELDFHGIRRMFNLYVRAPGPIVIESLRLYDLNLQIKAHDTGCSSETLRLKAFEMQKLDSRAPAATMAGCVVKIDETKSSAESDATSTTRRTSGETSTSGTSTSASNSAYSFTVKKREKVDPFAQARRFIPSDLMSRLDSTVPVELIEFAVASQAVFQSLAPLAAAEVGLLLEQSGSASLAELGKIGGTGEALLDAGVVAALLAQGFPKRMLADGGALAVKLVESGVGKVLVVESADVLKVLIEKRMIDRVLDLDLMDALLDRPELTKEMLRSGVVKGVLRNGVLRVLLTSGKESVATSLLRGPMIETLMNTGLLPAMMTFEVPGDERLPPPTGSVDGSGDEFEAQKPWAFGKARRR
jgi:hypothetical protein